MRLAARKGLAPDEFVWLPVKETDMSGMLNGAKVDPARPISEKSALRVLRMALRKAGVRMRSSGGCMTCGTRTHLLLESNHNLATIQARLHHSSLATTGLYVKAIGREDPVDTFSAQFQQLWLSV